MADAFEPGANVPRGEFGFDLRPETDQAFENALAKVAEDDSSTGTPIAFA